MKGFCTKDCEHGKCSSHVHLDREKKAVTLTFKSDKTNWTEKNIFRTLRCVGDSKGDCCPDDVPLCPFCAIVELKSMSGPVSDDENWFLAQGKKSKSISYNFFLLGVKEMANLLPDNVSTGKKWGTHSMRRAGSQMYFKLGKSFEEIKQFGRWGSSCIWLYLCSAPLDLFYRTVSFTCFVSSIILVNCFCDLTWSCHLTVHILRFVYVLTARECGIPFRFI
jgi:hypothetical protein